jgi:two-component system chemotaxis response regulator CheB
VSAAAKIGVLVIDDSALVRQLLTEINNREPDMRALGAAPDPLAARELVRTLNPDVITLDVEMPRMDGLEFLSRLMRLKPTPVVMVSSRTARGADATLRALELGAIDFVEKPADGIADGIGRHAQEIVEKIRTASRARLVRRTPGPASVLSRPLGSTERIVAIGASTGGTEALRELLERFPPDCPGTLVTQHMPPGFTKSFADRLNSICRVTVCEAEAGQRVLPGHVFIAPGDRHLLLRRSGANYVTALSDGPPVNRHRPSVEALFRSVAQCAGANALGVMLTGMGKDGAAAMLEMKQAGAYNFAQDEASCIVFGMPREAIAIGAVDEVVPLAQMADRVFARLATQGPRHVRI